MKKFTFLLISFFSYAILTAQTFPVSVSGVVSNLDGTPASGVSVFISTDSLNFNFEYDEETSTAADGTYEFTLDVPNMVSQGSAFVFMRDCDNNFVTEFVSWHPGNTSLTADFIYCIPPCTVTITAESNPSGSGSVTTLTASSEGAAPYDFQWNTGETTASIEVLESGWYCATVTDGNGCSNIRCFYAEIDNIQDTLCFARILPYFSDTSNQLLYFEVLAEGIPPFTYLWNTGATTSSVLLNAQGEYCVTVTDATGCIATDCETYEMENCGVSIFCSPAGELAASGTGVAPFTYLWNTGETASSIFPTVTGEYCVTITDATGCSASICTYHFEDGGQDSCDVFIVVVQNGAWLQADASGIGPFTYEWSNGSYTPFIELHASGTYCVTVTDATGCSSSDCFTLVPNEPNNYQINGVAIPLDSINILPNQIVGSVYLIVHDEDTGTLTAIDTVEIDEWGYYDFGLVEAGNYLIKAAYSPESELYDTQLPTYYGRSLWWNEATTVTIPYGGIGGFKIVMIEGENPGGPGFIGGLISEGANFNGQTVDERSGDPLAGISVLLLTEDDAPVTHTVSDENGEFAFPNLPWGTYKVYVEIVGLEPVFYMVTIGPDQPEVTNLTFEVGDESVLGIRESLIEKTLRLFPNPTSEQFFVSMNSTQTFEAVLQVTDLRGRTMWSNTTTIHQGVQQLTVNIQTLPTGIYFLNIQTGKEVISRKIVKE